MRQTDRTRMGLALAGLLFCLTSAATTISHRNSSPHGGNEQAMANDSNSHRSELVNAREVLPGQNPVPIWRQRLNSDSSMRLLTLWPKSNTTEISKGVAPKSWDQLVSHLTSATAARTNNSPTKYVAMFYRPDGSLDWLLDIKADGTLYDPLHHRYLHADGWWTPNQMTVRGGGR